MAHNDIEIEIQVPVDKITFGNVKKELESTGKLLSKSHNIDTYYSPCHRNFLDQEIPFEWLSIRFRGKKTILNYKHWHKGKDGFHTHCDEYETDVLKKDQLEKIFKVLNMKKLVKVDKVRYKYQIGDKYEVCLDRVKGLGFFVEIEALKDFGGVKKTREKLIELAKLFKLDTSKYVPGGYAFALIQKKRKKRWIVKS